MLLRKTALAVGAAVFTFALAGCNSSSDTTASNSTPSEPGSPTYFGSTVNGTATADALKTATPIKHVVVIYNENVSFDHYFATYPNATNPKGEPVFTATPGTPSINGLSGDLLSNNPNYINTQNTEDGRTPTNPFRIDRSQQATSDQIHAYTAEQLAYDNGKADLFPKYTGIGSKGAASSFGTNWMVMGYFDGNTVTGMWNYAQNYAMSDNAYTDTYSPSTPGALAIVSGQTNGVQIVKTTKTPFSSTPSTTNPYWAYGSYYADDGQGGYTMINDVDPGYDACSSPTDQVMMKGKNIGDLLNTANITWGSFMGGFDLTKTNANGTTSCKRTSTSLGNVTSVDYIPHHAWFQYYASTANPTHARPSSTQAIGYSYEADGKTKDPANHEYSATDFFNAVKAGNYPAVAYVKAPGFEDGHAGYSDPLDEQVFTTKVINFLMQQPDWKNTAVIIAWDDSDGWYDHAYANPTNPSFNKAADQLNGPGVCGTGTPLDGIDGKPVNGRCGPGTRTPFIVVSPYAKQNFVSHTQISQASVVKFIEDNWLGGERLGSGSFDANAGSIMNMFDFKAAPRTTPVLLDSSTGEPKPS
ncbi:MAG: phospholipase [Halothiobacillus sp. 14-56-357]|jgi:phospholipase C|uniref:phospholipase C n=1 Tax=Halothiobacillus sp. 15-55-196 TaxID=1970382 RepID=UPI000BDCD18C|nr:alkaline phosphatase family protein [Halothiobacillus sp. 15-55-196]OZB37798.1 MAG: phospholipase [Halothiobacillus sp. 15-55-196]OZB57178.1 MAG: phospholipase [Halothiobacillus sp. 14-56-357]OZB77951.1 MAG: phospholipase [Halothiobacillus sp. 13-55-115]